MTGIVKHAENANKARRELAFVKQLSNELIPELVFLVKSMYLLNPNDMEGIRIGGKPVGQIVEELLAAKTAQEMLHAIRNTEKVP